MPISLAMDLMEFRILNAYRDGDMKAHRREAKNTAPHRMRAGCGREGEMAFLGEDFKRMSSRKDGKRRSPRRSAGDAAREREPILVGRPRAPAAAYRLRSPGPSPARADPPPPAPSQAPAAPSCMARCGSRRWVRLPGGDEDGQASWTWHCVDQLSHRHESGRRSEPGARPLQSEPASSPCRCPRSISGKA